MTAALQLLNFGAGMALRSRVAVTYALALPVPVAGCPQHRQSVLRQHPHHCARASSAPRWRRRGCASERIEQALTHDECKVRIPDKPLPAHELMNTFMELQD